MRLLVVHGAAWLQKSRLRSGKVKNRIWSTGTW